MKSNKIYEEKFKENRENMFLPKCKTTKEVNKYLLKIHKNKFENKKNEDWDNNNDDDKKDNLDMDSDKENDIVMDIDNKENRNEKESFKQYGSISIATQHKKKSILKKSNINISPTNLKYNKNN